MSQLREHGYAGLRLDAIAAATGVARTTIYRRWPSTVHLAIAAMTEMVGDRTVELTGDTEADLRHVAQVAVRSLIDAGPSLGVLAADLHRQEDPALRAAYRAALVDPVRDTLLGIVRNGQATGALRPDIAPEIAVDALIGGAVYLVLVLHEPLHEAEADAAVDLLLNGLAPPH